MTYEELGVTPIVSAARTLIRVGGASVPPEVVSAMVAANRSI